MRSGFFKRRGRLLPSGMRLTNNGQGGFNLDFHTIRHHDAGRMR